LERWSLERVVEMTADYMRRKEDAVFEAAFAQIDYDFGARFWLICRG
jgi:hypothetical protein